MFPLSHVIHTRDLLHKAVPNAHLNREVWRLFFLNMSMDEQCLSQSGRAFHSLGACIEKALS